MTTIRTAYGSGGSYQPDVAWVTLPGRNSVRVDLLNQGKRRTDDELIAVAQAHWAQRDREDAAGKALSAKYPSRQVFVGYLPSRDGTSWDGEPGWYAYVVASRRKRGAYPVEEAVAI